MCTLAQGESQTRDQIMQSRWLRTIDSCPFRSMPNFQCFHQTKLFCKFWKSAFHLLSLWDPIVLLQEAKGSSYEWQKWRVSLPGSNPGRSSSYPMTTTILSLEKTMWGQKKITTVSEDIFFVYLYSHSLHLLPSASILLSKQYHCSNTTIQLKWQSDYIFLIMRRLTRTYVLSFFFLHTLTAHTLAHAGVL